MNKWIFAPFLFLALVNPTFLFAQDEGDECDMEPDTRTFSSNYNTGGCRFTTRYNVAQTVNPYFIMEPGWQIVLEGEDDDEFIRLEITVTKDVELVDGVWTRVVEEREFIDGELYEISRNFFAICLSTNDIYYFGEDVDFYEDGEIIDHHGEWRAGVDGAKPGIISPGTPMIGARYYQEVAPGIAEDRAEIIDFISFEIDDEVFENAMFVIDSNPLDEDPCGAEIKIYAPGIGLISDGDLELVEAGFIFTVEAYIRFKK